MNRQSSLASYETRMNRVVDFIYDHLEDEIDLPRLAEVACLSPYHWHRIYSAMRGETIAATVRRLRLSRAADRLANTGTAIAEIADRAGYGSPDAFGRAFKEAYGKTPADYRTNGSHAGFKSAIARDDIDGFPIETTTLPTQRCAGVGHTGSYMEIGKAIGRLFSELATRNAMAPDQRMLAIFYDDPELVPVDRLQSEACSPVADGVALTPPLAETVLRGGRYARLRYRGPYADMRSAYRWLLGTWLPNSGEEADDAPVFEAYLNNPREVAPPDLLTDIYLPLRST